MLLLLWISFESLAQERVVTGKVTSAEDGSALPGVNVIVKGTGDGTVTDASGAFVLKVPANETLVFSFIGFETQELEAGDRTQFNVSMRMDATQLNEVVVVAYGEQTKKSFTGSAATVTAENLQVRPLTSFENALQGLAAGVQVSSSSGQPGGAATIRVRGTGSLNASSEPLYVIDGVPVASGDYSNVAATSNVMATINPADIETVTVLKDASAASLYGSRAANGVVLITTKRGKEGKAKISVSASTGFNQLAVKQHDVLNASEYFKVYWDYYYNTAVASGSDAATAAATANTSTINLLQTNPYSSSNVYGADGKLNSGVNLLYDSDWRDAVLKTGKTQNYSLDASGGNSNTRYYISGAYFNQQGIVPSSNFKRYSAKINLDTKVNEFIKVGFSSTNAFSEQNTPPGSGGAANPIRFSNLVSNVYSIYQRNSDGSIVNGADGKPAYNYNNPIVLDFNALGNSELDKYYTETLRTLNSIYGEVNFLKNFKFKSQVAADIVNVKDNLYYNPEHGNGASVNGRSQKIYSRDIILNVTNHLTWNKTFGDHKVEVLLGQEAWKSHYETMEASKTDFPVSGLDQLSVGSTPVSATSSYTDKRIASYFSRLHYSFRDRYYLSASLRRDGSSVFGTDNRYGNFWSVGASWVLSEEPFMKDVAQVVDLLKLKSSYGISGNDNIGRYAAKGLISFGYNYYGEPGSSYTQLQNASLHWEQNRTLDVGLEFGVLNSRITGEVVYFKRVSDDLLFDRPISQTTGFSSITSNLAKMENRGIEVTLNSVIYRSADWKIGLGLNITRLRNEILAMSQDYLVSGTKRWRVGTDRYQFYIQEFAGVDAADGLPMWYKDVLDANGQATGERETTKTYSQATRYEVGSALPKFYGGINPSISYKNFDLTAVISFKVGGKIYDQTYADIMHAGSTPGQQLSRDVLNSWTTTNTNTDIARFVPSNADNFKSQSTRFLFDGSYARVKNVTLGYNLPRNWVSRVYMNNARLYVTGENIFTMAKHKGLDPELPDSGVSDNLYPANKAIIMGVNLTF